MRAHQIMTRPVVTVTPETTIVEAANIMLQRHVSGLPVLDASGKLVGIISEGDFIRRSEIGTQRKRGRWLKLILGPGKAATDFVHEHGTRIAEVMVTEPVTISAGTMAAWRERSSVMTPLRCTMPSLTTALSPNGHQS